MELGGVFSPGFKEKNIEELERLKSVGYLFVCLFVNSFDSVCKISSRVFCVMMSCHEMRN